MMIKIHMSSNLLRSEISQIKKMIQQEEIQKAIERMDNISKSEFNPKFSSEEISEMKDNLELAIVFSYLECFEGTVEALNKIKDVVEKKN